VSLDATDEDECNWLCLVGVARCSSEQNCMAIQMGLDIFYMTTREVPVGEELLVWYAPHYAKKVGRLPVPDGITVGETMCQLVNFYDQTNCTQLGICNYLLIIVEQCIFIGVSVMT